MATLNGKIVVYQGKNYTFADDAAAKSGFELVEVMTKMGNESLIQNFLLGATSAAVQAAIVKTAKKAENEEESKALDAIAAEGNMLPRVLALRQQVAGIFRDLVDTYHGFGRFKAKGKSAVAEASSKDAAILFLESGETGTIEVISEAEEGKEEETKSYRLTIPMPHEATTAMNAMRTEFFASPAKAKLEKMFGPKEGETNGRPYNVDVDDEGKIVLKAGAMKGAGGTGEKTTQIEITIGGKTYDGDKSTVAQEIIAAGYKPGEGKVPNLSLSPAGKPYYSKWLDVLGGRDGVVIVRKYNKS